MYVRSLRVQNVKLLRDVKIDFTDANGKPRMWTVFVGENRLCKTTLLQTIAAAGATGDRASQLVSNVITSWPDLRDPKPISIDAELEMNSGIQADGVDVISRAFSSLSLKPDKRVFAAKSGFHSPNAENPVSVEMLGADGSLYWFIAGYGPSRFLPSVGQAPRQSDPMLDRLRPLFGEPLVGTGFIELLDEELGRAFVSVLESVFVAGGVLPHITGVDLRGRGSIRTTRDLADAQRFEIDVGTSKQNKIQIPASWLSQGYQTMIAWLADLVGQLLVNTGEPLAAAEMTGTVLIDEIDVHLHPSWQVKLIPALKQVFPKLQFIATTHSPMVLAGLDANEVFVLSQDEEGSVVATQSTQSPSLLTGSELFASFFQLRKLYPNEQGRKLHRYSYLASDPTRSDEEDAIMKTLRQELEAAGIVFDHDPVEREP